MMLLAVPFYWTTIPGKFLPQALLVKLVSDVAEVKTVQTGLENENVSSGRVEQSHIVGTI